MPDQTHNFLINYETTATRAVSEMQQVTRAFQDQIQWTETATAAYQTFSTQSQAAMTQWATNVTQTIEYVNLAWRGYMQELSTRVRGFGGMGTLRGFPGGAEIGQRTGAGGFQEANVRQQHTIEQRLERFTAAHNRGREALDGFTESTRKSGHWLGRYLQRYLIRYLVVWQGMIALQTGIRAWTQAHEELDRTLFSLQTTMGMTADQAERYINVMGGIGGAQAGMQVGAAGGMAMQFGAMTGMGGAEGAQFLGGVQRQFGLDSGQLEELIPRMWAAFAESGEDIQTFLGHWQELINAMGGGSDATAEWARALEIYETTGMRATDRVSAAWTEMLSVIGNTQVITDSKNAWADFFSVLTGQVKYSDLTQSEQRAAQARYEKETGGDAARVGQFFPTGDFWDWFAKGGMEGSRPSMGGGGVGGEGGGAAKQFIDSVDIMTRAQFERLSVATEKYEGILGAQGIESSELTRMIAIQEGDSYTFSAILTTMLANTLATEEMNEQMKTGVYNWPGNVAMIAMGVGAATSRTTAIRHADEPAPPPYTPLGGSAPYIPGANPSWNAFDIFAPSYQYGGVVQETGPAIVHKGETITPEGQSPINYLRLQSDIYMDGNHVAQSVSTRLGDQLYQAQRAAGG